MQALFTITNIAHGDDNYPVITLTLLVAFGSLSSISGRVSLVLHFQSTPVLLSVCIGTISEGVGLEILVISQLRSLHRDNEIDGRIRLGELICVGRSVHGRSLH